MDISNYIWNMDIFLTITHVIAIIGLYLSPEPCEARFFMDLRSLFDVFWTVLTTKA